MGMSKVKLLEAFATLICSGYLFWLFQETQKLKLHVQKLHPALGDWLSISS